MSAPVPAQSISSLNTLLANPPRYPRNPTHAQQERLILYIVRVPGSQDVFLTPLKPPTKASISIDAVQSSLYFLHVERPEDDELRKSLATAQAAAHARNQAVPSIHRKPLPAVPHENYPASQRPPTPPKSYPHFQLPLVGTSTGTQAERYAARGSHLRLDTASGSTATGPLRKPLGARPMRTENQATSPHTSDKMVEGNSLAHGPHQAAPIVSVADGLTVDWPVTSPAHDQSGHALGDCPAAPDIRGQDDSLPDDMLRITLIRREPSSGSQWNVGTISRARTATGDHPLDGFDIELAAPGYTKFAQLEGGADKRFARRVAYTMAPSSETAPPARRRSNSAALFASAGHPTDRRLRQTYAFLSPWQGSCTFSNGIDGRSLRCRHSLPTTNPAIVVPPVDVAELRFNLPWSTLRLRNPNKPAKASDAGGSLPGSGGPVSPSSKDHWRRSFQSFADKASRQLAPSESLRPLSQGERWDKQATQSSALAEGRMNLDLGREKAGGGFKGQSAKLGKLIIDDEGLKMCDLVVAACMGLWWQHYQSD